MTRHTRRPSRPDYVLCWGPIEDQANDCIRFRIEAHPHVLTKERDCVLTIQRSALTQEPRSHMLAWAAGFKAIEALSSSDFLNSIRPSAKGIPLPLSTIGATANELRDYAERASRQSEARQATKCSKCSRLVLSPRGLLTEGGKELYGADELVPLRCERGHSFERLGSLLVFFVKPLD